MNDQVMVADQRRRSLVRVVQPLAVVPTVQSGDPRSRLLPSAAATFLAGEASLGRVLLMSEPDGPGIWPEVRRQEKLIGHTLQMV